MVRRDRYRVAIRLSDACPRSRNLRKQNKIENAGGGEGGREMKHGYMERQKSREVFEKDKILRENKAER